MTIEIIPVTPTQSNLEEMFTAGDVPDIIMAADFRYLPIFKDTELAYDMTELIERHRFDISRFDQNFLELMRSYSEDSTELWGLPFMQNKAALHYNKDIFDLFGVEYPTDDMIYEEVIDLAAKVTGERGGINFDGFVMPSTNRYLYAPLGLTLLDPVTDEPQFLTEPAFRHIFDTYKQADDLLIEASTHGDNARNRFVADQDLAMIPMYFIGLEWTGLLEAEEQGMNWDIVTFPKWEEQGDVSAFADGYWIGVSAISEHKDQAFKVIEFLLSDEEIIRKIRYPEESVYADEEFFEQAEHIRSPLLNDKNMEALIKYPAPPAPDGRSQYEDLALEIVGEKVSDFLESGQDVNTFLRELQEEIEKRIEDEKGSQ